MKRSGLLASTALLVITCNVARSQSMPGMNMPSEPKPQPAQHRSAAKTVAPPKAEDSMPSMQMPAATSASPPLSQSVKHDTMNLQEPENPAMRTGTNVPAPDLLKDIAARPPMELKDFLSLADKRNPTLAQANALVRRSAAEALQAGLYPNPSAAYQGEQIRGGSYGGGEQGGYVQQTIVLGGKLGLRRDVFNQQKRADEIGVEEQTLRIQNDVMQAFYTALTSQAMVVVWQRLAGVAADAVETAHQLANVGQADAPDVLEAEVESEQAKIDYVSAQRKFIRDFRTLAAMSGDTRMEVSPLRGALESPPDIDAEGQAAAFVASSPKVKRLQQEVGVTESRLKAAKREAIPDMQIKVGEQYNFERIGGTPGRGTGPQSFASAGVDIPLCNRNQGNIAAAQAEIERARQEVVRMQLSLKEAAEPLAQSYLSARFTAERYKTELIPRAQRAYQLYSSKYEGMAMAYPQVLVSQRMLFQLQIGYLNALHEVWSSAIALQHYGLSGGLDAPISSGSGANAADASRPLMGPVE